MKVLFVAHSGAISGGANRILLAMMALLKQKHGVICDVLVPVRDSALEKECRALGIDVYTGRYHACCTVFHREPKDVLRLLKLLAAPAMDWFSAGALARRLPDDYDLVYTNDRIVIVGGYLARRRGIAHIWHARCFGHINQNHFPPRWSRLMERYADRIVTISTALYQDFVSDIQDKSKLQLIHDGVKIGQYWVDEHRVHEGICLLLAGRIVPSKGQMDAVRALDILVNRHHEDIQLYFAGELPQYASGDYPQELTELIDALGLKGRVHFLGEVQDMAALRSRMDIELMCAWCEAFGLVSVEAMCAGLPVVGSRSGGTPDIIEDGVTGLLYRQRDVEDLAQKLLWLCRHPQKARQFGEAGRKRVKEMFSIERCTEDVYRAMVEVSNANHEDED